MDNVFPESYDQYDGYVITGSPASVNDPEIWIDNLLRFIRELDEHRIPTVGCCFGHQAIAKALGGKVDKNSSGWQLGRAETDFHWFESWNQTEIASLGLYSAHCEQVFELPVEAVPLGSNPNCNFASFKIGDHFFTTQYHPEMSFDFMYQLLDYMLDNNEIGNYSGTQTFNIVNHLIVAVDILIVKPISGFNKTAIRPRLFQASSKFIP